ncbi:MAG: TlpA family protein disulfide reductase [Ilumatobacter sp.]|uniref:TlpA family protein disulfide reductase n=1 Tax=Ilumatobacter sp. TaxID=1967498 RepID=UPI0039194635
MIDELELSAGSPLVPARRRVAPWIAGAVLAVLAAFFVMLVMASPDNGAAAESPLLGRPAPAAVGELDDGTVFDLSRRKGSWVVLNFFRADCVPCIEEHPELISFVDQQRSQDRNRVEFYSVVVDDTREDVEEFFAARGGDWPVVYSDNDSLSVAFGVAAVPETWIIDADGIVRVRYVGKVTAESLSVTIQQLREGAS